MLDRLHISEESLLDLRNRGFRHELIEIVLQIVGRVGGFSKVLNGLRGANRRGLSESFKFGL